MTKALAWQIWQIDEIRQTLFKIDTFILFIIGCTVNLPH